jgi:hypothetical protein
MGSIMLEICCGVTWVWVHAVLCRRVSLLSWRVWLWFFCTYLNYCRLCRDTLLKKLVQAVALLILIWEDSGSNLGCDIKYRVNSNLRRPLISRAPYFEKRITKKKCFQSNTFHSLPLVLRGKLVWDVWIVKNNNVPLIYFAPWLSVGTGIAQSV